MATKKGNRRKGAVRGARLGYDATKGQARRAKAKAKVAGRPKRVRAKVGASPHVGALRKRHGVFQ